jgi:hypothetical protein
VSRPAARDLLSALLDAPMPERVGEHQPYHGPEAPRRHGQERAAPQKPQIATRPARGAQDGA